MLKLLPLSSLVLLVCPLLLTAQNKPVQKPLADTVKIAITNPGKAINSPFPDYAPVISADGETMVFTSRRPVTEKDLKKNKVGMEHVYVSDFDEKKKKWGDAKALPEPVNQPGRHNSAIALSNDGQRMLLYKDDTDGNGDIYESRLVGDTWTAPVKFPEPVNSTNHESSASISPDGSSIYVVSNRKGGKGGRDIWICRMENDGKWGKAQNMGGPVNTTEDEEGVFIHPDGKTLYFSSKGHHSTGGYDIFKSVRSEEGVWSEPESLGPKINTVDDDLYFVLAANGQTGFYTSDRPGGLGDKDLYEIRFTSLKPKKESGPQLTLLRGLITDELSGKPLEASIEIIDNVKNELVAKITSNSSTGKYLVSLPSGKNYGIVVKSAGYLFHSVNVNIPYSAGYQEVLKDVALKKIEVGKSIVLNNIFYDFDKATLRAESMSELDRLVKMMKDNATITIEISSYTDNKGSDDYNEKLSQQRAQSVVDFLIDKGIESKRLIAKGYGESVPVSTNDTEEGRQQNRRTEFKILSR